MMSGFIVAGVLCSSLQFVNKKLNSTISYAYHTYYLLFAKGFIYVRHLHLSYLAIYRQIAKLSRWPHLVIFAFPNAGKHICI